jgi:nucleoside-diphosphate-sugar epimerase
MPALICFGLGYSAEYFVAGLDAKSGDRFDTVVGTVRSSERAAALNATFGGRIRVIPFDGSAATPELTGVIAEADAVLVSIPQTAQGDPVLAAFGEALVNARRLRSVVYLSTVGVYGDHRGAWVDETTPPAPDTGRANNRLVAERAWQAFGERSGVEVAILRLAGIYGPGRNPLIQVANGEARRIVKPGQVFNRIHVADIAQAIEAAFAQRARGIFNVTDDEPAPPGDPIAYAAELMERTPPPLLKFDDAAPSMSPMALSFWQDCRRVKNDKLKRELGVKLLYPTYREGLRALNADSDLLENDRARSI